MVYNKQKSIIQGPRHHFKTGGTRKCSIERPHYTQEYWLTILFFLLMV